MVRCTDLTVLGYATNKKKESLLLFSRNNVILNKPVMFILIELLRLFLSPTILLVLGFLSLVLLC